MGMVKRFSKMSKLEQMRYLAQLRVSNAANAAIRHESKENRAYSNQGMYSPPWKADRFDGFHDND
jgi:hypothetical protein